MNLIHNYAPNLVLASLINFTAVSSSLAGDLPTNQPSPAESTSYGMFGMLDHRSGYGEGVFPEPFLNDDSDLELNEFRLDWLRADIHSDRSDELKLEYEKGFGMVTLEAALIYDWEKVAGKTDSGFGNAEIAARTPFYQFVSADHGLDTTLGAGFEVGIPMNTDFSQSTELVPKIFNDTRLGDHFTVQTIIGYSALYGGDDDGIRTLEYGVTFGYSIDRKDLAIPGVQRLTPIFEIQGEDQLNKADSGHSPLVGNAAFRVNLNTIRGVQPRLGMGYVFPLNSTAREELHWGIVTSLVFEY